MQSIEVEVVAPLKVSNPVLTQAVNNFQLPGSPAQVDLVKGKSTAAILDVSAVGGSASDTTPVTFTIDLGDGSGAQSVSPNTSVTIGQIVGSTSTQTGQANTMTVTFANPPLVPQTAGSFTVTFAAKAGTAPSVSTAETDRVQATSPLSIDYFLMTNVGEDVSSSAFAQHVQVADSLFTGMYPIAKQGLSVASGSNLTSAPYNSNQTGLAAIQQDLETLALDGALTNAASQAGIGIVADNYFADRGLGSGTRGIAQTPVGGCQTPLGTNGAIAEVGFYDTTQHEVAHTFGLQHAFGAPAVNGFWVDANEPIFQLVDLMNYTSEVAFSSVVPYRWTSSSEYQCIFEQLLNPSGDPQVVLVAGFLNQNGTVTLSSTKYLSNGIATPFNPKAAGSVQLLNSAGTVVSQASFVPSFSLLEDTGTTIPTTKSAFLVQLPASQSGETIQISQAGKVVSSLSPGSQLLIESIKDIPDSSFRNNRKEKDEREDLLQLAGRIERQLGVCQKVSVDCHRGDRDKAVCVSEVLGRITELRERIDQDLNDSTVTTSPQQLTKGQVLATVDFVLLQTLPDRTVRARTHAFHIRVVPDELRKVVEVASVTQGAHGTIEIEKNGQLLYAPESKTRQADSFTVTLTDVDGASVVKTVSIVVPQRDDYDEDERREIFSSIEKIMSHRSDHGGR